MKQKSNLTSARSGVGTGTTSLLMIFTVLCFATLAMLSLSTAAANQRIQQRGMDNAAATATAKGDAARAVAELDSLLYTTAQNDPALAGDEDAYYGEVLALAGDMGWTVDEASRTVSLVVAVSAQNELLTELQISPPGSAERYTVLRQVTRLAGGWEAEDDLGLWGGETFN